MKSHLRLVAAVFIGQFAAAVFAGDNTKITSTNTDSDIQLMEAKVKIARMTEGNTATLTQNKKLKEQLKAIVTNARLVLDGMKAEKAALEKQVASLQAQVRALEARPAPFSAEELLLFRNPESTKLAVNDDKSGSKLPAGAAELIAEARRLFEQKEFKQAGLKYLEVLKLDSRNVYTLGNLATISLELGEVADAEKYLELALAVKPDDGYSLGVLGNLRFRERKYDQAFEALSAAARLNPKDAVIQNFLAVTLSQKGQRTAAEAALRKAIELDPEYASAHNNLAVVYLSQTPPQIELARWHYHKALANGQERNPDIEKSLGETAPPPTGQVP